MILSRKKGVKRGRNVFEFEGLVEEIRIDKDQDGLVLVDKFMFFNTCMRRKLLAVRQDVLFLSRYFIFYLISYFFCQGSILH